MQSILANIFRKANIFRIGVLRLSAGTYEATASTAAAIVRHLERLRRTFIRFGNVRKEFLSRLRGKNCNCLIISWSKRIKIGAKIF